MFCEDSGDEGISSGTRQLTLRFQRSVGFSAHGCCGVADGKWEGGCHWAGG